MQLQCCNSRKHKRPATKKRCSSFSRRKTNVWRRPAVDYGLPTKLRCSFIEACEAISTELGLPSSAVRKKMTSGIAKHAVDLTWEKFLSQEDNCFAFNQLLSHSDISSDTHGEYMVFPKLSEDIEHLLDLTVDEINGIVTLDWVNANRIYIGPGAAITHDHSTSQPLIKFDQQCWSYPNERYSPSEFFDNETATYIARKCCGSEPDRILQVPKNNSINRTIGVGTVVGIASQHVCEQYIRRCMQRHGINLNELADEHRELAWLGSIKDRYQTIDFSMASDSLSLGLITRLFGGARSSYRARTLLKKLLNCRATHYRIADTVHQYYKISAMGNASTFGLETLVFTALGRAITKMHYIRHFKLYATHRHKPRAATSFGDDLILDLLVLDGTKEWVCSLLAHVGLQVNEEKSFFTGDFRESCGGDYKVGKNIRGLYLHNHVVYLPDVIRSLNFFHVGHNVPLRSLLSIPAFRGAYDYYQLKALHSGEPGSVNPFKPVIYDNTLMMDDLDGRRSYGYIIRQQSKNSDKECTSIDDIFMFLDSGQCCPDFTPRFRPRVLAECDSRSGSIPALGSTLLDLAPLEPFVRIKGPSPGNKYKRALLSANGKEVRI